MFDFLLNEFSKLKTNLLTECNKQFIACKKNNELLGRIYNLENKLNGKLPVNKLELIKLIQKYVAPSNGFNNFTPKPLKSAIFRVTTVK